MTHATNVVLDPHTPFNTALAFIETEYSKGKIRTLHFYRGEFYAWTGTQYCRKDADAIRSEVYRFLDSADCVDKQGQTVSFRPTRMRVNDVIDALKGAANLDSRDLPPFWISDEASVAAPDIIACKNGLLHFPSRKLLPHTPDFFNVASLQYPYDPNAPKPIEWFKFLKSLWADDTEAIDTLQDIFGYLLTSDTSQQKIFQIIGPTRSGKGVIGRVLTNLVGPDNVVSPTLASLSSNFGLQPLIDKQIAIIADARLSSRPDQQQIAERLLSISGEDSVTIDRKYLSAWSGILKARFWIASNELPRLADASGALAKRFINLVLQKSFYGKEDHGMLGRVLQELPGILNWALEGLDRLSQRGHFVQPASSREVAQELEDLGSPIRTFLREYCEIDERQFVEADLLYAKYRTYCSSCGHEHFTTIQTFGRDLRAAVPSLRVRQSREGEVRKRRYIGVGLKPEPVGPIA
jgi:putative DNA primase/helicase